MVENGGLINGILDGIYLLESLGGSFGIDVPNVPMAWGYLFHFQVPGNTTELTMEKL